MLETFQRNAQEKSPDFCFVHFLLPKNYVAVVSKVRQGVVSDREVQNFSPTTGDKLKSSEVVNLVSARKRLTGNDCQYDDLSPLLVIDNIEKEVE